MGRAVVKMAAATRVTAGAIYTRFKNLHGYIWFIILNDCTLHKMSDFICELSW